MNSAARVPHGMSGAETMDGEHFAEVSVTVSNTQGVHGRPASQMVRVASRYPEAEVTIWKDGFEVNGKSIFGLMMLAAGPGTTLKIVARGKGAPNVVDELRLLIESRFGEESVPS